MTKNESKGAATKDVSGGGVDGLDEYREAVRADGFKLNPYRLGLQAGRANAYNPSAVPPNPYLNHRSRAQFQEGVRRGIEQARYERRHAAALSEQQS